MNDEQIHQLRYALAQFNGRELTPMLAQTLVDAAAYQAERGIDVARFESEMHGDYTIAAESFRDILHELHPLHERHWLETEKHRHGLPFDPDYEAMSSAERAGHLLQVTLRHRGKLAGNLRIYVGVSLHSGTPFAVFPVRTRFPGSEEDTLYIDPQHRGGSRAVHMLRYTERCLIALGVREGRANSKLVNNAAALMRRLKWHPVATQFVKVFEQGTMQ